jgi:hypothetical protein
MHPVFPEELTMASKNPPNKTPRPTSGANEGEGNKSADRHYREATEKFVNSERGKQEIEHAGDVSASEQQDIERAEEQAKSRAREHDPEETRGNRSN